MTAAATAGKRHNVSNNYRIVDMRTIAFIMILIFASSCKQNENNIKKLKSCYTNFTFSKGNIHVHYLLNINSSDTVYYKNRLPFEDQRTQYFLLDESKKKYLNNLICKLKFPKDSVLINDNIIDGTTIAFSIDGKRTMLHGHNGPKEFWEFEEWIENMKTYHGLKPINRKIEFDNFDRMLPIPPILTKVISKKQIIGIWETVGKELLTVDIDNNKITYREHKESRKYKIKGDSIYIYHNDFVQSGEPYFINDDTLVISTTEGKIKYIRKK